MASIIYHQKGIDQYYKVWHTSNENLIIYMEKHLMFLNLYLVLHLE